MAVRPNTVYGKIAGQLNCPSSDVGVENYSLAVYLLCCNRVSIDHRNLQYTILKQGTSNFNQICRRLLYKLVPCSFK